MIRMSRKNALIVGNSFLQAPHGNNYQASTPTPNKFLASDNFWKLQVNYLWRNGVYPSSRLCSAEGCHKKHMAKGLCQFHRWQELRRKQWDLKFKDERYMAWRKQVEDRKVLKSFAGMGIIPRKKTRHGDLVKHRYKMAIYECAKRKKNNFKWLIGLQDFRWLCQQPCFYCGGALGSVRYGKGVDRIDSTKDYVMGNVYPCCTTCNRIKGHDLSSAETKILIETLFVVRRSLS